MNGNGWTRQRAEVMCSLASLPEGRRFAFVAPSVTGSQTVIKGIVVGPGDFGGVLVLVNETGLRKPAKTEWSGRISVLPLLEAATSEYWMAGAT